MDTERKEVETIETAPPASMRWRLAFVLLLAMPALRALPTLLDSSSFPLMIVSFMGPAVIGLLLVLWWCFASRVSGKEKIMGLLGLAAVLIVGLPLTHRTLQGMPMLLSIVPTAIAAFTFGLVLFTKLPRWRVPIAVASAAMGVGYWDALQSEGVTGRFEMQLLWRWQPTAEESYLQELRDRDPSKNTNQYATTETTLQTSPWPSFRGDRRDGVLAGVTLVDDWNTSPPEEMWRRRIGPGWSSFSAANDRLYTQEQRGESESVVCLSAETGETLWDVVYPSRFWEPIAGAGPRATPTLSNEGLFALGGNGMLLCVNPLTGNVRWKRDLKEDAERAPPTWGFSASPLVAEGMVIVHAGGDGDKGLFAYRTSNGEIAWSTSSGDHSYSSAQIATFDGRLGALMMTNDGLQFIDLANGQPIWKYDWKVQNYRALQPLVLGSTVFVASSLGEGTRRIDVARSEDGAWEIQEAWTTRDMKSEFNDFVHYEGAIYGFDGSIFASIDADSGKRNWKRGRYGNGQVLLLADSGQLLITSEKGKVILVQASAEKLDERSSFQAISGKTWNHSVLVNDRLYVRNAQEAACYRMPIQNAGDDE
ncbi:MAG: PQQ-binding-like beta-propeller repeat protein [Planctomycetota bacterium]